MDLQILIMLTITYMNQQMIEYLDETVSVGKGCWRELCVLINGSYELKKAYLIRSWWKFDRYSYRSSVLSSLDNKTLQKTLTLRIERKEVDMATAGNKRRFFLASFADKISILMQERGHNCWLTKKCGNWISAFPHSRHYWKGLYKCKECEHEFSTVIAKYNIEESFLEVSVTWYGKINHEIKTLKQSRIVGDERKQLAMKLSSEGIQNVFSEFVLIEKRIEKNILSKIKSEFNHRNRLDTDILVDIEACKRFYHSSFPAEQNGKISGYVQDISLNPFGFTIISDIQVI